MQWQSFQQTLRRDLQASWQKTALLGSLLLVGLWFWVPPLMRAVWGGTSEQATQAQVRQELPEDAGTQATRRAAAAADGTTVVYSWETVETLLDSDPLVQSAEMAARHNDPFGINPDQFAPPVIFAEEQALPGGFDQSAAGAAAAQAEQLVLKSTIVGEHRRGALINRRLYLEGSEIKVGGKAYILAAVFPRKVVLKCGAETLELKIARPQSWNGQDDMFDEATAEAPAP